VTLIEVTITTALLAAVLAMVFPMVGAGFKVVGGLEDRADSNDQAHLALAQIERDVRSGNVIEQPGPVGGQPGMEVRIYTQTSGVPFKCVQYQVASGRLERRTRDPGPENAGTWPTTWRVIATGLTNTAQAPAISAFVRSGAHNETLTIDLFVNRSNSAGAGVRLRSSVTGRNSVYYDTPNAVNQCA
jgi:type II secretory pathway component PulJ